MEALGVPTNASEKYDELVIDEIIKLATGLVNAAERSKANDSIN